MNTLQLGNPTLMIQDLCVCRNIVWNGCDFIAPDVERRCIIRMNRCFRVLECVWVARSYACLCYDPSLHCYWAIADDNQTALCQLSPQFEEIGEYPIHHAKQCKIVSISYDCYTRQFWLAYPDCIAHMTMGSFVLAYIKNREEQAVNEGVYSTGDQVLVSYSCHGKGYIDVWQADTWRCDLVCLPPCRWTAGVYHLQTPMGMERLAYQIHILLGAECAGRCSLADCPLLCEPTQPCADGCHSDCGGCADCPCPPLDCPCAPLDCPCAPSPCPPLDCPCAPLDCPYPSLDCPCAPPPCPPLDGCHNDCGGCPCPPPPYPPPCPPPPCPPPYPPPPCPDRHHAKNLLIHSIALEEAGIAHILNAEGEKIQMAVQHFRSMDDLLCVNESVRRTINQVTQLEGQLLLKLEAAMQDCHGDHPCAGGGLCPCRSDDAADQDDCGETEGCNS